MMDNELNQIRAVMREELAGVEGRLAAKVNAAVENLMAEIRAAEERSELRLNSATTELTAEIRAAEERSQEFARDIESNLLKAYHGYAESNQARLLRLETAEAANSQRLAALERRVLELETRRPPQQAQ